MSFKCSICKKGPTAGKSISHSHRASNRIFKPNVQRQRIVLNGVVRKTYVCTSCIRSGKIQKAV